MPRRFTVLIGLALTALLTFSFLAPTSAEAASKKVTAGSVKITGTAKVGLTLTATATSWKPAGVSLKYQWYRSGKKIGGATKVTYTLKASDLNKQITVKATGSRSGYKAASKTSGKTKKVALGTISDAGIELTGAIAVGGTVRVAGGWVPSDAKVSYQWYREDTAIKGATKRSYQVAAADYNQRLGVSMRITRSGYKTKKLNWQFTYNTGPRGSLNGVLEVGTDIQPGTYVGVGGTYCNWERQSSAEILAKGPNSAGQIIVTVNKGDRYFFNLNCGIWKPYVPASMTQITEFSDGQFAVGPEIKPGTYQTTSLLGKCYWQTNSGFDGSFEDFIADGHPTAAPVTVVLDSSVVGFESRDCGTWTRISD